jgi:lactoylglutathione lyase
VLDHPPEGDPMDQPFAAHAVNHVGHCTPDLAQAQHFYVDLLGFELDRELTPPDGPTSELLGVPTPVGLRAVYLRLGDFTLELLHFDRPGNPPAAERVMNEPGLTHLSISVDDVEATAAAVPAHGGEVLYSSPHAAMVRDPDGQLLELLPMAYRRRIEAERAERGDR